LADGTYSFTVKAADLAGNVSVSSAPLRITIDSQCNTPRISGVTQTLGAGSQTLWVNGAADPYSTVTVLLQGQVLGTVTADAAGDWRYGYQKTQFAVGSYPFTARATDAAGNVSAVSAAYNLLLGAGAQNLAAPLIASASVLSVDPTGTIHAVATPTFTGTAKAGTVVTVVDGNTILGTAVADSTGKWSFLSPKLAGGTHTIAVFATDSLGNSGLLSASLTVVI
jgi:hypothetical protein